MTANPEAIYNQALADIEKLALDHGITREQAAALMIEAAKAYNIAAIKHFGEYARLNTIPECGKCGQLITDPDFVGHFRSCLGKPKVEPQVDTGEKL